ncbi:MAG: 16S rRNA (cytosine(967)-C(5))-methyltransferase RsmB [Nitrospiraceae bacterium]|nr:16S rRNA (cytosine(967)-C(5))-methyltransferase RsmB [Nitrospiraceae bacterium]
MPLYSNARMIALQAIGEIRNGSRPKDALDPLDIDKRDRALVMELVYGVLRRQYLLDHLLSGFLSKLPENKKIPTLDNLRMGLYQMLYTRVPERAAVNESVELEKAFFPGHGKPSLVNAVLRNAARGKDAVIERLNKLKADSENASLKTEDRQKAISIYTSSPLWLIKRWAQRLGADEALALAEAGNRIPPLVLRVNTLRKTREEVLEMLALKGIEAGPTQISPSGIKIEGHVSWRDLEFIHPFCIAQDEAAQLVSFFLAPFPEERILDACAAPGGKTTHIAELMKDRGEITALDTEQRRVDMIRENMSRLGLSSIHPALEDITSKDSTGFRRPGYFDRILLDAPCSSLGVIRRNPDVKYRQSEDSLARSGRKELEMLMAVAAALKKGGALVYSTCSTEPEEGEMVIKKFLADANDFYMDKDIPDMFLPFSENGFIRTYPHRQDMDGFFMAKLIKLKQ